MLAGVNHSHLVKFATRIVGPQDAEDVVQTAYLKALLHAREFRGEADQRTWVYAITTRVAFDTLRRRSRKPGDYGTESVDQLYAVIDVFKKIEDRDMAEEMLADIPAMFANAIRAFAREGSYEAAALALGLPVKTLKSRIRDGREAMGVR